jgi:hypothetical protein
MRQTGRNFGTAELLCDGLFFPEDSHYEWNNLYRRAYRHHFIYSFFSRSALGRSTF